MNNIPTYEDSDGNVIQFRRVQDVPGYSHRVVLNGLAVGWLGVDFKPSSAVAGYFLREHGKGKNDDKDNATG